MKQNSLILGFFSILLLSACTGKDGGGTPSSEKLTALSAPGPEICGDPDQPTHDVWAPVGPVVVPCPDACPDGSHRQCSRFQEEQIRCIEGFPQQTGVTRVIGPFEPLTACPVTPQACGDHANGSQWWQETGHVSRVCELCQDGSPHRCQKAVESELICENGTELPTGQTRDGRFISYENECLPPPMRDCGDHQHGTFWWEEMDREQEACQTCWDGSSLMCEYALEGQRSCMDGNVDNAGFWRRGRLIGTIGSCPAQPKNCGDLADGKSEWRENGQGQPYNCETCIDGSFRQCVKAREEEVRCSDGDLVLTGGIRDGKFLGYLNNCPADIEERTETVTIGVTTGKADVLFILDTTPSMNQGLGNLGKRFLSLISSWSRIDWQMAVTNAKMEKGFGEAVQLQGSFMPLQTNNEGTISPRYILKKDDYWAEKWYYKTLSRDPEDYGGGCGTQPYCMMRPPEPMHVMMAAIDKRNTRTNKGFFRPGSKLVTIMITNSDEREKGDLSDPRTISPDTAIKHFNDVLGSQMAGLTSLSVMVKPGDAECLRRHTNIFLDGYGGRYGNLLNEFSRKTDGFTASICDTDYAQVLSQLSEKIRQQVESLTLKDVPHGNSLKITFTPSFNASWILQGKKVIFDRPIPSGTRIDVRYLVKVP